MGHALHKTGEMPLFYGATPITFEKANLLRKQMTEAEKKLWAHLKNKQLNNLKFRRQHPINIFIADFYCHELKLVIEVDGKIHLKKENIEWDKGRTAEMQGYGIKILRFTNEQVLNNIEIVLNTIRDYCLMLSAS